MELSENSYHNFMNENSGNRDPNRDRVDDVSKTDSPGKNSTLKDIDLPQCSNFNVSNKKQNYCANSILSPWRQGSKSSKKREYFHEMEHNSEITSSKFMKLSGCDDTTHDSKVDADSSTLKTYEADLSERKYEEKTSLLSSIDDCVQETSNNPALENLIFKETNVSSKSADVGFENECVPSTSDSGKSSEFQDKSSSNSSKSSEEEINSSNSDFEIEGTPTPELSGDSSSQDTSSCGSSSSSSDYSSMFSDVEDEDEDDHFGLVSHEGINSEDEQNSEADDDKLPPVLEKTLPVDKFSFPKEILLRQINSGDCKRRRYSNFESKVYGSRRMVQRLELFKSLKKHTGCVNTLSFNDTGNVLISASDDKHVSLWNWAENKNLLHFDSGHSANVFQAKFLPYSNDRTLITCGQDRQVRKCELDGCGLKSTALITKHGRAVHKLAIQPQMANSFLTAGEDGVVYSIDTRENNTSCTELLKLHKHHLNSVTPICLYSINCNPVKNYEFILGGSCEKIRLYDQRNISSKRQDPVKEFRLRGDLLEPGERIMTTVTCAVYNYNGTEILASYNDNDVFLFNCNDPSRYAFRYDGHRNITTIKGVNFFGPQSEFVVSGSDCGYIYIWDKKSESIVQWMKGDKNIVNCLETHPSFPVLATSGLDSDVKIWMPLSKGCENITSKKDFQKVVKKNLYYKRNTTYSRDEGESDFIYFLYRTNRI